VFASLFLLSFDGEEDVAKIDWNQLKTGTSKEIYYYPRDDGNYVIDWYHSLFRTWLADPDKSYALLSRNHESLETWMYPVLTSQSKPGTAINSMIQEVLGDEYTGKTLKNII
jgi:hypothetical protein